MPQLLESPISEEPLHPADSPPDAAPGQVARLDFPSLKLRSGTWLQLQAFTGERRNVEFISSIPGKSIFVTLPAASAAEAGLQAGQNYVVSGFNGVMDFRFTSRVIQVLDAPFAHAHLSVPDSASVKVVRQTRRVKVSVPASVAYHGENVLIPCWIRDLSTAGAMIESHVPFLGKRGDKVELLFRLTCEGRESQLRIPSAICHSAELVPGGGQRVGLEFERIARHDKLILCHLLFIQGEQ